jgi:radical SAM superfamily enzyme YgiQ (UPF0313 family)
MYKGSRFRIRKVQEIKEDLDMARDYYGDAVRTVFFADGNTIIMRTKELVEIFTYTRKLFPHLERITLYGSARFIVLKSQEELDQLKAAGLGRLHSGMESGDDEVLKLINKGADADTIIRAGKKVMAAGIELSEYLVVGVGGRALSQQHAKSSAKVLNEINPDFIRLRTFMPMPGSPLHAQYKSGAFELLSPHEALQETRLFIENLGAIDSKLLSDHVSNYWYVEGSMPNDKGKMLQQIDYALTLNENRFRRPENGAL